MDGFKKYMIFDTSFDFEKLSGAINFEDITNGRKAAIFTDINNDTLPIIRTTTIYKNPSYAFSPIHYSIIDKIKETTGLHLNFNNAMAEIYNFKYYKMGYHSDQSLDLDENSYICLFSCYSDPTTKDIRKLRIKNKNNTSDISDVLLEHNSCVLFSYKTNRNYLHKIILENGTSNVQWFGLTLRMSKTFVKFIDDIPYFTKNFKQLILANDIEKKQFYKLKKLENDNIDYVYPDMNFTLSIIL